MGTLTRTAEGEWNLKKLYLDPNEFCGLEASSCTSGSSFRRDGKLSGQPEGSDRRHEEVRRQVTGQPSKNLTGRVEGRSDLPLGWSSGVSGVFGPQTHTHTHTHTHAHTHLPSGCLVLPTRANL